MHKDSFAYTMLVAAGVCVACSLVVSTAAITLRPIHQRNAALDLQRNILTAAGLIRLGDRVDVESLFQQIETRWVRLDTGEFVDEDEVVDPPEVTAISGTQDIAGIRQRADIQEVYLLQRNGELQRLILPIRGMGLWAMMRGLIALGPDLTTVEGLSFHEHGETPGLGGEVDNPRWRAQWVGKQAFDSEGEVRIEVIQGQVGPQTPDAEHKVDGLSGATFTARSVSNLVQFWLGEQGYGPFLENMRKRGG